MKASLILFFGSLLLLFAATTPARAQTVRYTFTGLATATAGTNSFVDTPFTIRVIGNITNLAYLDSVSWIDASSATIQFLGGAVGTFTVGARVFVNHDVEAVGFSYAGSDGLDLLDINSPAFHSYELTQSLSAVYRLVPMSVERFSQVPSTLGPITFSSARDVTFWATAEVITYNLARESTITFYQYSATGVVARTEPLRGSWDWVRCPDNGSLLCFDATRLDFYSKSFEVHLDPTSTQNDGTGVATFTNWTSLGEDVSIVLRDFNNAVITGLTLFESTNSGTYAGPPEYPTRLTYTNWRIDGNWTLNIFAFSDPDKDGDGVPDTDDQCLETKADAPVNEHGCSIQQLVPCAGPASGGKWRSRSQYLIAVRRVANQFLASGIISRKEHRAIIWHAVLNRCGER